MKIKVELGLDVTEHVEICFMIKDITYKSFKASCACHEDIFEEFTWKEYYDSE